jgi:hypothetical protein
MQEKDLFEYAVIRVVPRVEREEFINVGVILYCPRQKFLQALFHIDEQRLRTFCAEADPDEIRTHLEAIERTAREQRKPDQSACSTCPPGSAGSQPCAAPWCKPPAYTRVLAAMRKKPCNGYTGNRYFSAGNAQQHIELSLHFTHISA